MADRATLIEESNARMWAHTGYKIGKPLDPKLPADKAMAKLWMAIFDDVQRQDQAGTLVMTHYQDDVINALADAQVASDTAARHIEAASRADPVTAQQHTTAAAASVQTAVAKAREARAGQPLNIAPAIIEEAMREAGSSTPPVSASAADQIAHMQMQNGARQNGQPPSAAPSQEALYQETNHRFWRQYNFKVGQKLDMSNFQDQLMAEAWKLIYSDVQREAAEGRLVMTPPPFGAPQDPYAEPQPTQDFSQPQYGAYGAPPGLTPPQYGGQPSFAQQGVPQQGFPQQDFSQQPQYGAYGAPPGLTPPQYGTPQGFPQPQPPQYGAPQEMPVPQYAASQQITPPQYGAPQDFLTPQYAAPQMPQPSGAPQQAFAQAPQQAFAQAPQQAFAQAPQPFQMPPEAPAPQQQFQTPQPPAPQQPQVPSGMQGFPPDILQYVQQAQPQPQQMPQPQVPQQQMPQQQMPQPPPQPPLQPSVTAVQPSAPQAAPPARPTQPARPAPSSAQQTRPATQQPAAQRPATQQPAAQRLAAPRPVEGRTQAFTSVAKVGLALLGVGAVTGIIYAARSRSHAVVKRSSFDSAPYLTQLSSRGGRY